VSLTLVLGPANSAKAGEVLGAYQQAARTGEALLIVPTLADAEHYDRELAGEALALGRARTFAGLIGEIARRTGTVAEPLSASQRERLLRRVLAGLERPAQNRKVTPGFTRDAGRMIAELERARVTPARFAAALRRWAGEDPGRGAHAAALAAIHVRYARALERCGRLDADRLAWTALDALRTRPARWGRTPVFLYGFDDLTALEHDAIETLHRIVGVAVTVSLTYERGRSALAARAGIAETLRAQADVVRELPAVSEHYADPALHHLERNLFEPEAVVRDPGAAVGLLEGGGERAEAELVAAEVLSALRDGVAAHEIVVVCRSLQLAGARLEAALERYELPCTSARTVALGHTAFGRGLLALARCAWNRGDAHDLLSFLRTPGACAEVNAVDRLELAIGRAAISALPAALSLPEARALHLGALRELREAAEPASGLEATARRLLAATAPGAAALLAPEAELDARAAAAVLSTLTELSELPDAPDRDELLELLAELPVPVHGPPGPDAILVAEPLSIRARRFRRVIVCGLVEGEFPAPAPIDPFLGEERRRELALAAGLVLPPGPDPLAGERYLLYASASRATERVLFSYRSSDEEGNRVLPSPFLDELTAILGERWRQRRRRRLLAQVAWPPGEAPTARERRLSAAAGVAGAATPAEPGRGPGRPEIRLLGSRALAHVRHREVVSGGALERFADCPVRWLIESQLRPAELQPDSEALTAGSFMHSVLERVIRELGAPVTPERLARAESLLSLACEQSPPLLAPGAGAEVRAAVLRGIEADLRRYLRHEARDGCEWRPHELELRFGVPGEHGEEPPLPCVELEKDGERILLRGVIDRIDVDPGGTRAIVRDYKSGAARRERSAARWLDAHQLQVGLYLIAVRRLLNLEPVAGFYQPLSGRDLRPRGALRSGAEAGCSAYGPDELEAGAFEELLAQVEAEAVRLAVRLRRGELVPCPESCSRGGCLHPGLCWSVT
jgi:ATP-dependent helicase/DNAse subunit B